jgi:hypothetical protein
MERRSAPARVGRRANPKRGVRTTISPDSGISFDPWPATGPLAGDPAAPELNPSLLPIREPAGGHTLAEGTGGALARSAGGRGGAGGGQSAGAGPAHCPGDGDGAAPCTRLLERVQIIPVSEQRGLGTTPRTKRIFSQSRRAAEASIRVSTFLCELCGSARDSAGRAGCRRRLAMNPPTRTGCTLLEIRPIVHAGKREGDGRGNAEFFSSPSNRLLGPPAWWSFLTPTPGHFL